MALKFNLTAINDSVVKEAAEAVGSGSRYDGPPPPPDTYNVLVKKAWFAKTKSGKDIIKYLAEVKETGDKATYNGYGIFSNLNLPMDPSDRYYAVQVHSLNEFVRAMSKDKIGLVEFAGALSEGKTKTGDMDKVGSPIQQVGKLKFDGSQEFVVKTSMNDNPNNPSNPYVNVSYIVSKANEEPETIVEEEDDDVDGFDEADDFLAELEG